MTYGTIIHMHATRKHVNVWHSNSCQSAHQLPTLQIVGLTACRDTAKQTAGLHTGPTYFQLLTHVTASSLVGG
jgi:hypothetical protein